jgi:alanine-glyoxylate transaminase/serine-glyoxylate transaminase/serine-pyruvate transaminase
MARQPGRHFLHVPGPTYVPDRVLRAMNRQMVDHRGPTFQQLAREVLEEVKPVFGTRGTVIVFSATGTGSWEAALVNTLSPGDKVLMFETGMFAVLWRKLAEQMGVKVEWIESDWRRGIVPADIEKHLAADRNHEIKAVCAVHNETSTGCISDIAAVRAAIDAAGHPALLMVDTVSGLGCAPYRHDEWRVDVTVCGSQKGLMLPPGLGFNAISEKAKEANKSATMPRAFWRWEDMMAANPNGFFPYTPATGLLYGLQESIRLMEEEGYDNVFARHRRHGEATRAAVAAWGLETQCAAPENYSPVVTTVVAPGGSGADAIRAHILKRFDLSLGSGLGKLADRVFRIGHLGDINDLTLLGALSGVEMGLSELGLLPRAGGVQAAMDSLSRSGQGAAVRQAAE